MDFKNTKIPKKDCDTHTTHTQRVSAALPLTSHTGETHRGSH